VKFPAVCRNALFLTGLFVLGLTSATAADWPRQVTDSRGVHTLESKPARIVSTSVTLTGSLLAIDAPVVASGATTPNNRVADAQGFLRQWGDIAKQRNVARLYIGEPSAEAVAAQMPDLILISATGGDSALALYDQLSAIAVDKGVQPVIVCTKGDLAEAEFLRSAYEKSTLPFIRIDYATGEGLDDIRHWINGRLCAFCGNSGVGKSTLLNALLPDVERQTAAISQKLGRGRHTTRSGAVSPTPRASPASRPAGRASSRKKIWNTPSRSSGLTSARASSPAAPTAPRRAAPSAPPLRKASSLRPATTATAPCTMRSRM
jgi:hypothetical protein